MSQNTCDFSWICVRKMLRCASADINFVLVFPILFACRTLFFQSLLNTYHEPSYQLSFDDLLKLSDLYGYSIEKIEPQRFKDISVSSSKIRKLIVNNKIKEATAYLGHSFCLKGKVVKGKKNGSKIGFPTANIQIENKWKLIPNDGVYAVMVEHNFKKYSAMMNIGCNPTFAAKQRTLEVHILDFNQDIYGEELRVEFVKRIREEKKFHSEQELKDTLRIDENKIRNLLK